MTNDEFQLLKYKYPETWFENLPNYQAPLHVHKKIIDATVAINNAGWQSGVVVSIILLLLTPIALLVLFSQGAHNWEQRRIADRIVSIVVPSMFNVIGTPLVIGYPVGIAVRVFSHKKRLIELEEILRKETNLII